MERYIPVAQTRLKGTARLVIVLVNKDTKERYWGQQFCQMERDISVRPTEMTRPVKEDHLQSWSRIFPSDKTEMFRTILCINQNFRNFWLNGKRPLFCLARQGFIAPIESKKELNLRLV